MGFASDIVPCIEDLLARVLQVLSSNPAGFPLEPFVAARFRSRLVLSCSAASPGACLALPSASSSSSIWCYGIPNQLRLFAHGLQACPAY